MTYIRKNPDADKYSVEIIDGGRSPIAIIDGSTIAPQLGSAHEYAKVILEAVSKHIVKRQSMRPITTQDARSVYAKGEVVYYFSEDNALEKVSSNSELYDFPNRQFFIE